MCICSAMYLGHFHPSLLPSKSPQDPAITFKFPCQLHVLFFTYLFTH